LTFCGRQFGNRQNNGAFEFNLTDQSAHEGGQGVGEVLVVAGQHVETQGKGDDAETQRTHSNSGTDDIILKIFLQKMWPLKLPFFRSKYCQLAQKIDHKKNANVWQKCQNKIGPRL
jgi:hypothetical protein